jgi:dihydroorotate dehydrogenase (NAD+) catalytic subunit
VRTLGVGLTIDNHAHGCDGGTMSERIATRIGSLLLPNPIICGSGEPVMTESGIRAALEAGAAGVVAKSVNEQRSAAEQLNRADYAFLTADHRAAKAGVSLFCRSGLAQCDPAEWFRTIAAIDREAQRTGRFVAASVTLGTSEGAEHLARLAQDSGLRVFELNVVSAGTKCCQRPASSAWSA